MYLIIEALYKNYKKFFKKNSINSINKRILIIINKKLKGGNIMEMYKYYAGEINEVSNVKELGNGKYAYTIECPRCGGHGKLKEFNHVMKGECFKCLGYGVIEKEGKLYTLEQAEKLQQKYFENKAKKQAKVIAEMEKNQKAYELEQAKKREKRLEEAKKEQEGYQAQKDAQKAWKKLGTEGQINVHLKNENMEELRYNLGFMRNYQVEQYIQLLNKYNMMKKSVKRALLAEHPEICKKYNIEL